MLTMLKAGFIRFKSEGYSSWSKLNVWKSINPDDEQNNLEDPEIQSVLRELESQGVIRLLFKDDVYLEVLIDHSPAEKP